MRVLLVKTSSMGDIIHTLPALTDAGKAFPQITFDWVVEDAFAEIPPWHPLVNEVIPIALRRWRKGILTPSTRAGWQALRSSLQGRDYDLILDAQGLVKSAVLLFLAKGKRVGLDWQSARESLASLAYQEKCRVNFYQHAIVRMRSLFSQALNYPLPLSPPDFGLQLAAQKKNVHEDYVVFLHGTTWTSKQWPENYWQQLAMLASASGLRIKIGGGNPVEVARAERIAASHAAIDVVPYLSIEKMAALLSGAKAAVAVDTGFGHLAAALNVPTVSLYGSTNPDLTGALGRHAAHLLADFSCAPCLQRTCTFKGAATTAPACYAMLPPARVWEALQILWRQS